MLRSLRAAPVSRFSRTLSASACLAWCAACSPDVPQPSSAQLGSQEQEVVYGSDDRMEYYQHPSEILRELTANAIVAMVDEGTLDDSDPSDVQIDGQILGNAYGLCADAAFRDQPTGASCSGTLIDTDLVLTAGHCVDSQQACNNNKWVFGYYYEAAGELHTITADDVYGCAEILVQSGGGWGGSGADYGIIRLDRPVTGRTPAPFNLSDAPVSEGDSISIIGFGSGLPAKLDNGGAVIDVSTGEGAFGGTTDSFGGNSGSGVFDDQGRVVGILVAGQNDYDYRGGCGSVTELADDGSDGTETITYAILAVDELCGTGYPSEALCDASPVCGDGVCSASESPETCIADCEGDTNPWQCDLEFYDDGRGCDCDCGAFDPDCADERLEIYNCGPDQVCSAEGTCVDSGDPVEPDPTVPGDWVCDPEFFGTGDGCDCECGALDADCADPAQTVFNCAPRPGLCSAGGSCADAGEEPTPDVVDDTAAGDVVDDTGATGDTAGADAAGDAAADAAVDTTGINLDGFAVDTGCSAGGRSGQPWLALVALLALRRRRAASQPSSATVRG